MSRPIREGACDTSSKPVLAINSPRAGRANARFAIRIVLPQTTSLGHRVGIRPDASGFDEG